MVLGEKPACGHREYTITAMWCPDGCCNTIRATWQEADGSMRMCEIEECNVAVRDPCWTLGCEGHVFNQAKYDALKLAEHDDRQTWGWGLEVSSARFDRLFVGFVNGSVVDVGAALRAMRDLAQRIDKLERRMEKMGGAQRLYEIEREMERLSNRVSNVFLDS